MCGLENNISILEKTERESREAGIYEKRQRGCCLCLHHPIYQPKPLSCYFQPTHSTIINLRTTYQHPCLYIYLLSLFFFPLNTLFFYFTIFSVLVRFRSNLVNTSPTSRGWPQPTSFLIHKSTREIFIVNVSHTSNFIFTLFFFFLLIEFDRL